VRLGSNVLVGDQLQLGKIMIAIGVAIVLLLAGWLLWGRIDIEGVKGH
jgi:hypothetical protein